MQVITDWLMYRYSLISYWIENDLHQILVVKIANESNTCFNLSMKNKTKHARNLHLIEMKKFLNWTAEQIWKIMMSIDRGASFSCSSFASIKKNLSSRTLDETIMRHDAQRLQWLFYTNEIPPFFSFSFLISAWKTFAIFIGIGSMQSKCEVERYHRDTKEWDFRCPISRWWLATPSHNSW